MAKYQLLDTGVYDTERGASIPEDMGNHDWVVYQQWLTDGGVPDPIYVPPPPTDAELLYQSDQSMIRAIDWLLEYLVNEGVVQLADIPQQLKDLFLERKAQREAVGSPQVPIEI